MATSTVCAVRLSVVYTRSTPPRHGSVALFGDPSGGPVLSSVITLLALAPSAHAATPIATCAELSERLA